MSAENVEIVRTALDAFARGDYEALRTAMADEAELIEWPSVDQQTFKGRDAFQDAARAWASAWGEIQVQAARYVDAGDRVLVDLPTKLTGKGSGVEVETENYGVFTVRESRIVRIEFLTDRMAAVRAAGLDEVRMIRHLNGAVEARDFETVGAAMHEDVVWEHNLGGGSPEEGVYRGRESAVALLRRILEVWEYMRVEEEEIRDLGQGRYLVRGQLRMKHLAAPSEFESPYEQLFEIRDGYLVRGRMTTGQAPAGTDAPNVEVVRRIVDAFNRRDMDSVVSEFDPHVELHEWPSAPGAATYRGTAGVRKALDSWFETWAWMTVRIVDIFETGDHVLVTLHQHAKGKGSEIEIEATTFNVYTFEEGKVTRMELFTEREPALAAAGMTHSYQEERR